MYKRKNKISLCLILIHLAEVYIVNIFCKRVKDREKNLKFAYFSPTFVVYGPKETVK